MNYDVGVPARWTRRTFKVSFNVCAEVAYGDSYHKDPSKAYDASGKIKLYQAQVQVFKADVLFDQSQQPAGDNGSLGVDG